MKYFILVSYLLFLPMFGLADEPPELVKVYCFSTDLEAGFKDEATTYWCQKLAKLGDKKRSLLLSAKEDAHLFVQYLGTEEIHMRGETTLLLGGYAWSPNETEIGARTIIRINDFSKGFYCQGDGARGVSCVRELTESWIRENRDNILAKAKEK